MRLLFYGGVALAALGLVGVVGVILRLRRLRALPADDPALVPGLRRLIPLNLAAVFLAVLGLGLALVGLILG